VIVKISGGGSVKPAGPTSTQEIASGKQPAPQGTVASSRGDKVELSGGSSLLQRVEEALSNVSVVDAARVDEVKQAISEGRFRVDSSVVADKLLAAVREHLLTHKQ
jgi:negative regulator of flagellin synthesis FlgM